jgi:anti-sigma factor RsiW
VQEHISVNKIEQYRKRRLSAGELLALDDHLAACEDCRAQIASPSEPYLAPTQWLPALETEEFEHPVYEQFAAYVDGQLDSVEREIVESHLSCCQQCSRELSDLETLKAQINSRLAGSTVSDRVVKTPQTWRERWASFWRLPAFRIPLQAAAAVVCVALLVWAVTLPLRKDIADLKAQLSQAEQRNEELQRDVEISKADTESLQTQIAQGQSTDQNPSPESLALALNDNLLKVDVQGHVEGLEALPAAYQQIVRNAIDTGQVKTPQSISSLTGKAGVLMGGKEGVAFALVSPLGTAVSSARPTFRWQKLAGATGYTVTVLDSDFNPVSKSPVLPSTNWTIAEPLERGRTYVWVVTAIQDGKEVKSPVAPAPEARFKVLDKEMTDEVLKTRRAYHDSHLFSGLVYAQAGLLDEAEREFDLLLRANPKSPVARKLLRNVKALRNR